MPQVSFQARSPGLAPHSLRSWTIGTEREGEDALKFFRNSGKTSPGAAASPLAPDVQTRPHRVAEGAEAGQIKVDLAYRLGGLIVVAGWSTAEVELGLHADGRALQVRRQSVPRPDVAAHFKLSSGVELGFVLVADYAGDDAVALWWGGAAHPEGSSWPLVFEAKPQFSPGDQAALGSALRSLLAAVEPFTEAWQSLVAHLPTLSGPCPGARGHLEIAMACFQTGEAVVVGWIVNTTGTTVWIEDDQGRTYSLASAFRRFRQDVHDAVGQEFGHAVREAGFLLRIIGLKPDVILRLKAMSGDGVYHLGEVRTAKLPADPVAAARMLFGIWVPISEFPQRVPLFDEPVLAPLIQHRRDIWAELTVTVKSLGNPVRSPQVSMVVPIYGRADFVEHQLIEFAADKWLREHAELVYVLDDPRLLESFGPQMQALHRIYGLPMKWVWGGVNRGFSGANNLGAENCSGTHLLFLNSDVFPQKPGWLEAMVDVLKQHPDVGAVGPRLVFANGAIQHAGMEYVRFEERGVWGNHHPYMGLDPSLDPCKALSTVSAVTGACLMLRRTDFDAIGGWDTGFLVGDFEDSDLCLKLRERGLKIAYLPTAQLTHLERQSFKLLGQDDFRARVAVYNAVRHQTRWGHLIQSGTR